MEKGKNKLLLMLFLLVSLYGCEKSTLTLLVAESTVPLYKSPKGDNLVVGNNIKSGDVCVPGKVSSEKVYQYTEVLCKDAGYGWIVDVQKFKRLESVQTD